MAHEEIAGAIALHHSEGAVKKDHKDRLLGALELETRTVEEIMLHRSQFHDGLSIRKNSLAVSLETACGFHTFFNTYYKFLFSNQV